VLRPCMAEAVSSPTTAIMENNVPATAIIRAHMRHRPERGTPHDAFDA
jgi:hypothetical protein